MKHWLTFARYAVAVMGALALLLTLVSVMPSPVWWVQAAGFPRFQLLLVLVLVLAALLALGAGGHRRAWTLLVLGVTAGLAAQAYYLWPYTPLAAKTVPDAGPAAASRLRLLVINVHMANRQDVRLRQLVQSVGPDVLLLLETNAWWVQALRPLRPQYPYRTELPRADTYGLVLYSRLPLTDTQVQDLEQTGMPAVRTTLRLPDGRQVRFFGLHPTPPIPDEYPDGVGRRNTALLEVARDARQSHLPVVVAGDFNDVPWSATTHRLVEEGQLRDVRAGRGLYTSFNARTPLLRWPLDHFFVSRQFQLVELQRLPDVGSDHFPVFAELALGAE